MNQQDIIEASYDGLIRGGILSDYIIVSNLNHFDVAVRNTATGPFLYFTIAKPFLSIYANNPLGTP